MYGTTFIVGGHGGDDDMVLLLLLMICRASSREIVGPLFVVATSAWLATSWQEFFVRATGKIGLEKSGETFSNSGIERTCYTLIESS